MMLQLGWEFIILNAEKNTSIKSDYGLNACDMGGTFF